jgi:hypothetical protein
MAAPAAPPADPPSPRKSPAKRRRPSRAAAPTETMSQRSAKAEQGFTYE